MSPVRGWAAAIGIEAVSGSSARRQFVCRLEVFGVFRRKGASTLAEQGLPGTPQGLLNPYHRRQQDIHVPGLDFLDRPRVEIHKLSEPLLGQPASRALPADVGAESLQLSSLI